VFHMLKAATGDYKRFLKRSYEEVVVLAHTHIWDLRKYRNIDGNTVVYANTGCWTNKAEEVGTDKTLQTSKRAIDVEANGIPLCHWMGHVLPRKKSLLTGNTKKHEYVDLQHNATCRKSH